MIYEHQVYEPGGSLEEAEAVARNNARYYLQESLARWKASGARELSAAFLALSTLMLLVECEAREGGLSGAEALLITQYAARTDRLINDAGR